MTAKKPPAVRDICGEYKGWNAHNRYGESQCDPCRKAAADYKRELRHNTGFSKATLYTPAEIEEIKQAAIVEARRAAVIETLTRHASRSKPWKQVVR